MSETRQGETVSATQGRSAASLSGVVDTGCAEPASATDLRVAHDWTDAGGDWAGLTPRQQDDARNFARRLRAHPIGASGEGEPVAERVEQVAAHTYEMKKQPGIPWEWLSEPRRQFLREFVLAGIRLGASTHPAPVSAAERGVTEERAAWIDGASWASMDNDEISVQDIEDAADEKFGPEAAPSDDQRFNWLESQTSPNHFVIVCALDLPHEKWASVQRVNQFHNPHKVEWCIEGETLRDAVDRAMREVPTLALSPDDAERDRSHTAALSAPSGPARTEGA